MKYIYAMHLCVVFSPLRCYNLNTGKPKPMAAALHYAEGFALQFFRKEGMLMYVTYTDLFQFCILVIALIGLFHEIFKGKR